MTKVYRNSPEERKVCRQADENDAGSLYIYIYSQVTRRLSRKPYFPDSFVLPLLGFRQDNSSPGWHSQEVSQRLLLLCSLDSLLQFKQWFYFPQFQCSGGVVYLSMGLSFTQVLVISSSSRVPFRSFIANFCCCFQPMVWSPHPYTHISYRTRLTNACISR